MRAHLDQKEVQIVYEPFETDYLEGYQFCSLTARSCWMGGQGTDP